MSEKPPIGEEIKKIQQQEFDDLDRLVQEVVKPPAQATAASEAPPIAPPETPPMPPVAAETKPAAGTAKTEPKFFSDVAQKRPQFSWEKDLAKPKTEPKPADVPLPVVPKPAAEPATEPKPEDIRQAELNKVINDLTAKVAQIDSTKKNKGSKFSSLAKSLGIRTRNIENDEEIIALNKEADDLYQNLKTQGIRLYGNDEDKLANFMRQYGVKEEAFINLKNEALDIQAKNAGLPEKAVNYFYKIGEKWSGMKWWQKSLIMGSAGLLTGGGALAVGYGTFGAFALTAGSRYAWRGFGAMAMGIGKKVSLEKQRKQERDSEGEAKFNEQMEIIKKYEHDLDAGIALTIEKKSFSEIGKDYEEQSLQNTRKALKCFGKTLAYSTAFGETFRIVGQETGINMGSILKKIGGAVGFGGGVEYQPTGGNVPGAQSGSSDVGSSKLSSEGFEQIQKSFDDMQPGRPDEDFANEINKMYARAVESDVKAGGVEVASSEMRASDTPPKIAELGIREIAPVKIGEGGTMWGSVEDHIKANPSAYGLDPNDANFTKDMRKMTQQMLNEFASRKGLSYEQLNQIARTKLRAGDSFKIMFDSSNNDLYIDDFHGKAFGANVSQSVPVEEIASNKPPASPAGENMAVEDVKPKTGASVAPDHQPSRGAGKTMQYDSDTPDQKIAKEDFVKADQYQKDTRAYNIQETARLETANEVTNSRLYLSTRGLLNQLVNGAGVGDKANFWQHLMDDWGKLLGSENYMAQDIQLADEARVASFDKLKGLFPILERYHKLGFKTIGDCLKEAVKDPKILLMINEIVLRK